MILRFLISICYYTFGQFEKNEFKKFLRMGGIFALIIGAYWTLKPLKDAIFIQLVGKEYIPFAKTISVLALLPLVMFYTKLLERFSREKMLMILPTFYGMSVLMFGIIMYFVQGASPEEILSRSTFLNFVIQFLGYFWYVFVESFGSLLVALFWAFSTDTTDPISAQKGFPLVVAIGQMGGMICPYWIGGLPYRLGLTTDSFSILILGVLILLIIPFFRSFLKATPKELLVAFHGKNETIEDKKHHHGFLEGLQLLLTHKYLIGIFLVSFIYEVIMTIFDFNFKLAAASKYSGVALSNYLSLYGSSVNMISLICLLLGVSNITRFLGVGVALALMPFIVGGALGAFLMLDNLSFLFALMVGSKTINYALNGPALKQLYIPTTKDVRFKAQAWIETFGSRASKEAGSIFNMLLKPLQNAFGELAGKSHYLILSGVIGFPLLVLWLVIAIFLGRKYQKAVQANRMVC